MNDKSWMFRAAATEVPQPRLTEQAERDAFEPYAPLEAGRTAEPATFLSADLIAPVAMTRDHDGGAINPNAFAIPAAQHDAHLFRVALVGCAVFAGLGLGLTSGFNWSSFLGNDSAPVQPDIRTDAPASAGNNGVGTGRASEIRKIAAVMPTSIGPGLESSQAGFSSTASKGSISSAARQNAVSSGPATASVQHRAKITTRQPTPETKPITIEGWRVREVVGATAVLEGPGGIWRATRGDTVPGVGKVASIVRWGNRWIVATSRGLISTQ